MPNIRVLPEKLANKIAAGEVVDRPASIVKELIENSIDANATFITLELAEGGKRLIQVSDNGIGMNKDDLLLAIKRHATSKIQKEEDLWEIDTLGFRGEALPSIATVSLLRIKSCPQSSSEGNEILIRNGDFIHIRPIGMASGTIVEVRELFANIPARRKFLRTPKTELGHSLEVFDRLAFLNHKIHFRCISEGKILRDYPACSLRLDRVLQIIPDEAKEHISMSSVERGVIAIDAFLSYPHYHRANARGIYFFVNNRWVYDKILKRTLQDAYEGIIPKGRFPIAVIFIWMPKRMVDVNVHPMKHEIRFRNPIEVRNTLFWAIKEALGNMSLGTVSKISKDTSFMPVSHTDRKRDKNSFNYRINNESKSTKVTPPAQRRERTSYALFEAQKGWEEKNDKKKEGLFSHMRYIGQVANTYLLLTDGDDLIILDQHAVHERILFDELEKKMIINQKIPSQDLLFPLEIRLELDEAYKVRELIPSLSRYGWDVVHMGERSFLIKAVPYLLVDDDYELALKGQLEVMAELGVPLDGSSSYKRILEFMACRAAVMAHDKLEPQEVAVLLEKLDNTISKFTCPHGRPLWRRLSSDELARMFDRT